MNKPGDTRNGPGLCGRRAGAAPGGFTLVEILLVLAVIALLGTLLLPGVDSLLRTINNEEPDRIFWDAVTSAREQALTANRTVFLRFDAGKKLLTWDDGAGAGKKELPAGVSVQFLQPKEGGTILLGGVLVETQEMPTVRFYPDGTCDRFRVQLRRTAATVPQIIPVDPWTCAPMIEGEK